MGGSVGMTKARVSKPDPGSTGTARDEFFLGRQPIVGREGELVAYELLFRSSQHDRAMVVDDVYATATVIKHAFSDLGIEAALGTKRGFINFDEHLLMSDIVEALPRDQVVLEVLEHVELTLEVVERCRALREAGYLLALDDVVHISGNWRTALPHVNFVKIDISEMTEPEIAALVGELRGHDVKLLAEKVETAEQYRFCRNLGFDLFQGYFLARPTILSGRSVHPSTLLLFKVIRLIAVDAEMAELEDAMRQAPDLMLRVLRMANASTMRQANKIYSLRNAIVVLGRLRISRIVQIMLFAQHRDRDPNSDPLVQMAAVRGRLMEEIATSLGLAQVRDRAFMVGILSVADALFSQPMIEILAILNLESPLQEALLHRRGTLGTLLTLVEAIETENTAIFTATARQLGLTNMDAFNRWHVAALTWAASL